MANKLDIYMPLLIGDWLKGTRGMRANVKGVYIGLLLYQWDNGFIPDDLDQLALIEPEVGSVWVFISDKFPVVSAGRRQNSKCEEVREFFEKQRKNGSKGGRPKKENPKHNPKGNPKHNPNTNLHNELELDIELTLEEKLKRAFDEIYLDAQRMKWPHLDFDFQYRTFCEKVRGSPEHYQGHDPGGVRLAFQAQLRNAKPKTNGTAKGANAKQQQIDATRDYLTEHYRKKFAERGISFDREGGGE